MLCRVCQLEIQEGQFAFDPAVDYSGWPDITVSCMIHKDCVPPSIKTLAEEYQRELVRSIRRD